MTLFKIRKTNHFVTVSNAIVTNTNVNDEAFRLFCYLMSNSDNWTAYNGDIKKKLNWTEHKLQKALKNLAYNGHIERIRRHIDGRFVWETNVYEIPQERLVESNSILRISMDSNSMDSNSMDSNSQDIIKNKINKNKINKNKDMGLYTQNLNPPLKKEKITDKEKIEINLQALEVLKDELLKEPIENKFIAYKKSQDQIWDNEKAKAQISQIFEVIEDWIKANPKKLTTEPNAKSRFNKFAENKDFGWVYPSRSSNSTYKTSNMVGARSSYESDPDVKKYF